GSSRDHECPLTGRAVFVSHASPWLGNRVFRLFGLGAPGDCAALSARSNCINCPRRGANRSRQNRLSTSQCRAAPVRELLVPGADRYKPAQGPRQSEPPRLPVNGQKKEAERNLPTRVARVSLPQHASEPTSRDRR